MGTGVKVKIDLKGIERKVSPMTLARAKEAVTNQMIIYAPLCTQEIWGT